MTLRMTDDIEHGGSLPTGGGAYRIEERSKSVVLLGFSCKGCDRRYAIAARECRGCRGELVESVFGPTGMVWASTVVRIGSAGRTPPYTLAYVDLADGPRLLAHVAGEAVRAKSGQAATLAGLTSTGDPLVRCS
jgi:hypothetical protein